MFKPEISARMNLLHTESAFTVLARATELEAEGRSIIHCEIGQPNFRTPENIVNAAHKAIDDGFTGYSPTSGYPELKEAIADFAGKYKHIATNMDEVVVVPGGKPVMFYTMLMLVEHKDEVIIPSPGFPIYDSCVRFAGGVPVHMPLDSSNGFSVDADLLESLITPKTKLLILNSPSNPTGSVFKKDDIMAVAEVLRRHPGIYILSDEIYDRILYDAEAFSIASVPDMKDRTVILDGFSKAYAMTGWRLGYGIMNKSLAEQMSLLMVNSNSCAASFTQIAAIEALKGPQTSVTAMRDEFRKRRDYLIPALNAIPGMACPMPEGAFYAFPDISSYGVLSRDFCERLLTEAGVAASWGSSFGRYGEGHFRISYANSMENIKEAVSRIDDFVRKNF